MRIKLLWDAIKNTQDFFPELDYALLRKRPDGGVRPTWIPQAPTLRLPLAMPLPGYDCDSKYGTKELQTEWIGR